MKKIAFLFLVIFSSIVGFSQSMKFVAVRNNPVTNRQEFIQWDTLSLPAVLNDSAAINGVVSGSSTFNPNNGNFYISTFQNNQPITLVYNVNQRNNFVLNNLLDFGVETKVDLSNGKLYSVHAMHSSKRGYISVTDPVSGVTSLVDSLPNSIAGFLADGMVFNSNTHHLYFYYIDRNNVGKLMDVDVSSNPVTMNSVALGTAGGRTSNMTLEFDLNTNLLHFLSIKYNSQTQKSKIYFGIINPTNGAVSYEDSTEGYSGVVLSSGTFDQTGQNMCISAVDSNNRYIMVGYQVLGAYWFETALPAGNIYEIEANNYAYAQAKYASTSVKELRAPIHIYPNPAQDFLQVSGAGLGNRYRIYNQNGQLVLSGKISQNEEKIDVSKLNSGLFLLMMEGTKNVSKFIINKGL